MFQLFLQLSSYFSKWQREGRPIICAENFSYCFVLCSVRRFEHAFRTLGLLIDQESGKNCLVMMIMWFFCFTCAGTLKRLPVFFVQTVPCSRGIFAEQMQGHFRLRCLQGAKYHNGRYVFLELKIQLNFFLLWSLS